MRTLLLVIFLLLSIILYDTYQILTYKWWYPRMIFAADTFRLDYLAQRDLYLACKNKVVHM